MSTLEIVIALAGASVTAMVVIGMILLTPSGAEDVHGDEPETVGADLGTVAATVSKPEPGAARARATTGRLQ